MRGNKALTEKEQWELHCRQLIAPYDDILFVGKFQSVIGDRKATHDLEDGSKLRYITLHSGGFKSEGQPYTGGFKTEKSAIDGFRKHLKAFLKGKKGIVYWRTPPTAQQNDDNFWSVRARLEVH